MQNAKTRFGGVFFGWWIVLSSAITLTATTALLLSGFGAYFIPIQDQLNFSKTALSGAYSMSRVESGMLGPVQGWLIEKLGPRLNVQIGIVILGAGFMLFSQVHSLTYFYLTFFMMSLGASFAGYISLSTSIVNWFEKKRSTALGLANAGFGIGGLLVPAVAWSIINFGWRPTAFWSGVLVLVLLLPVSFLVRRSPEDYGMTPDGLTRSQAGAGVEAVSQRPTGSIQGDMTAMEAMKTSTFWLISLGQGLSLFALAAVSLHLIPYSVETIGLSVQAASGVLAAMTAFMLIGQFGGGFLADRFNKKTIVVVCFGSHVIAMLGLAFAGSLTVVLLSVILLGIAWGIRGPLMAAIRVDYFGRHSFASIMGFASLVIMVGHFAGPLVAGYSADVFQSYRWGFVIVAGIAAVGTAMFAAAPSPVRKAREVQQV